MTVSLSGARFAGQRQPGWLGRRRAARAESAAAEVREAAEWMACLEAAAPGPGEAAEVAPDAEELARREQRRMHAEHVRREWLATCLAAVRRHEVPFIGPKSGRVL